VDPVTLATFGLWLAVVLLYFWHHPESATSWAVANAIHYAMVLRLAQAGGGNPFMVSMTMFVPAFVLAYGDTDRTRLLYKLLLMWLGGLVIYFSGAAGGPDPMKEWIMRTFQLRPEQAEPWLIAIRKGIHLTFYATVASLGVSLAMRWPTELRLALRYGLCCALAIALYDEGRQAMTTIRTGQLMDVGIDALGATLALWILRSRLSRAST